MWFQLHLQCALPTELHDTPYIYSLIQAAGSHTSLRQRRAHPHYWTCNQDSVLFVQYVAMLSQPYSAFNLTTFPRTCATTCQPYCSYRDQPVVTAGSEITSFLPVVLTGWVPSLSTPSALRSISLPFQLRALHEPRHLSVGHGVITATAYSPPLLPLCIQYIQPTCRDFTLARPSAFVEGEGFEPPCFGFKPCSLATQTPLSQPPCSVCRYVIATSTSILVLCVAML